MLKRLFDIAVSATGLIISAPITLTAAAVIAKRLGKPVLLDKYDLVKMVNHLKSINFGQCLIKEMKMESYCQMINV